MAQASTVQAAADSRGEEFSFTMIVDDHDADVHDRDSMVRCIHQCSG